MTNDRDNSLTALIAGIIIGAGVTYLFTTKDGQKIKEKMIAEGTKLLDQLKETLEEAGETTHEIKQAAEQKLEEAKDTVENALEEVPEQIAALQKKGRRFFFKKHPHHTGAES